MSARAAQHPAVVEAKEHLSAHLVRLTLGGLDSWVSTGLPDEWVGLVVPGQFQSRYYTVRSVAEGRVTLDVVVHEAGLVTEWVATDCVGQTVTVTDAKGSFEPPEPCEWLLLVGDLTALPAMARIVQETTVADVRILAEVEDELPGYLPEGASVTWRPGGGESRLAAAVEELEWPAGEGYFWMAGESAQMRAIRKHLMRERRIPGERYNVMGYWRAGRRHLRAADPAPRWRTGTEPPA